MQILTWIFIALFLGACSHAPKQKPIAEVIKDPTKLAGADPRPLEDEKTTHQRMLEQGFEFYNNGDYIRAINLLQTALLIESQPQDERALDILFYCYMATGNFTPALKLSREIVRLRPNQSTSYKQLGLVELWQGKNGSAIRNFRRAQEFENHSPMVFFYFGIAHEKQGNLKSRDQAFASAEKEYLQVLKANPLDFAANYELATIYLYWNKEIDKSGELITKAQHDLQSETPQEEVNPKPVVYLNYYLPRLRGIWLFRKAQFQQSLASLFHAIANAPSGAKPEIAESYYYIGENFYALKEKQNARAFLEFAQAMDPNGPHAKSIQRLLKRL